MKCLTEAELAKLEAGVEQGRIAQQRLDWLLAHLYAINASHSLGRLISIQPLFRGVASPNPQIGAELLKIIDGQIEP